ncbi:MAG TPA: STAS domain-containing protein [Gammaproteobacteria bacterium]|nr:STAS domain-containing protein [Gammaproteobacteria bacterium]
MERVTEGVEFESLGNGRFIVSGELSFATAEAALDEGERLFEHFQEIDLDFAHIGKTDSAGLAVLIEWISRANRDGKEIRFRHVPGQLHALAEISEVEDLLPVAGDEAA